MKAIQNLQNFLKLKPVSEMTLSEFILSLSGISIYYPCDDASGTVLADAVGSNDGTLSAASSFNFQQVGQLGNCIQFKAGTGADVTLPVAGCFPIHSNTAFTISMFLKLPTNNPMTFFQEADTAGTRYYWFYASNYVAPEHNITLAIKDDGGDTLTNQETSFTVTDNTWVHLAIVDNNGTVAIYKNGVASTNNHNYTRDTITSNSAKLGERVNGAVNFPGYMQHVAFFNQSVSQANILIMAQKAGLA